MALNDARATSDLERRVEIETPEQVVFSYTIAGIGSRAAAALIDHAVVFAALLVLWVLFALMFATVGTIEGASVLVRRSGGWLIALLLLVQFVVQWGYYVLFEGLRDGQTPGKRWLGLRVVRDGGYSASFGASAARNIARILDMQPGVTYAAGLVAVAVSKTGKRLGDHLAGTIVVRERLIASAGLPAQLAPVEPEKRVLEAALTDAELDLLRRFVARAGDLDAGRRAQLAAGLAERLRVSTDGTGALPALDALLAREEDARARGLAGHGETGAARDRHALILEGSPRWQAFAAHVADVRRRGLRHLSGDEVAAFAAGYREVATDLARLSTAARGRELDALFQLSRLVASGHNLLYGQERVPFAAIRRFLFVAVPAEVRRSWRPIAVAAILFFGSGAVTVTSVLNDPSLVEQLVGPAMIDRAEVDAARARSGDARYIDVDDYARPVLASAVIRNNIQVTFLAFASGLTAGIGTVLLLMLNGIAIGSAIGLFATRGVAGPILDFVVAHSVFELSAICIAAGGGFLIAGALLLPGSRTRRDALVMEGGRALRLLAAATLLLVLAGLIEGLISPRADIASGVKVLVAAASLVLLMLYVSSGRRAGAPAAERLVEGRAVSVIEPDPLTATPAP